MQNKGVIDRGGVDDKGPKPSKSCSLTTRKCYPKKKNAIQPASDPKAAVQLGSWSLEDKQGWLFKGRGDEICPP